MKYILEGKMMIEENVLGDYFSSDINLWDIAEEAEECYKDKNINLTGAFIEDQTTGELVGGKDLLNALYEIIEFEADNCCTNIYLVKEDGSKLKFNRYKGYRYYVLQGENFSNALMTFNDDLTHDDYIKDDESLTLIGIIYC